MSPTSTIQERFTRVSTMFETGVAPHAVKREIFDLIAASIDNFGNELGYWEKIHIGSAINNLASNLAIADPKSMIWLRLCAATLAIAFVPKAERNENATKKDAAIDRITATDLRTALQSVASRLGRGAGDPPVQAPLNTSSC
jgi:hypothetical protein